MKKSKKNIPAVSLNKQSTVHSVHACAYAWQRLQQWSLKELCVKELIKLWGGGILGELKIPERPEITYHLFLIENLGSSHAACQIYANQLFMGNTFALPNETGPVVFQIHNMDPQENRRITDPFEVDNLYKKFLAYKQEQNNPNFSQLFIKSPSVTSCDVALEKKECWETSMGYKQKDNALTKGSEDEYCIDQNPLFQYCKNFFNAVLAECPTLGEGSQTIQEGKRVNAAEKAVAAEKFDLTRYCEENKDKPIFSKDSKESLSLKYCMLGCPEVLVILKEAPPGKELEALNRVLELIEPCYSTDALAKAKTKEILWDFAKHLAVDDNQSIIEAFKDTNHSLTFFKNLAPGEIASYDETSKKFYKRELKENKKPDVLFSGKSLSDWVGKNIIRKYQTYKIEDLLLLRKEKANRKNVENFTKEGFIFNENDPKAMPVPYGKAAEQDFIATQFPNIAGTPTHAYKNEDPNDGTSPAPKTLPELTVYAKEHSDEKIFSKHSALSGKIYVPYLSAFPNEYIRLYNGNGNVEVLADIAKKAVLWCNTQLSQTNKVNKIGNSLLKESSPLKQAFQDPEAYLACCENCNKEEVVVYDSSKDQFVKEKYDKKKHKGISFEDLRKYITQELCGKYLNYKYNDLLPYLEGKKSPPHEQEQKIEPLKALINYKEYGINNPDGYILKNAVYRRLLYTHVYMEPQVLALLQEATDTKSELDLTLQAAFNTYQKHIDQGAQEKTPLERMKPYLNEEVIRMALKQPKNFINSINIAEKDVTLPDHKKEFFYDSSSKSFLCKRVELNKKAPIVDIDSYINQVLSKYENYKFKDLPSFEASNKKDTGQSELEEIPTPITQASGNITKPSLHPSNVNIKPDLEEFKEDLAQEGKSTPQGYYGLERDKITPQGPHGQGRISLQGPLGQEDKITPQGPHKLEEHKITPQGPHEQEGRIASQGPLRQEDKITPQGPHKLEEYKITPQGSHGQESRITSQGPHEQETRTMPRPSSGGRQEQPRPLPIPKDVIPSYPNETLNQTIKKDYWQIKDLNQQYLFQHKEQIELRIVKLWQNNPNKNLLSLAGIENAIKFCLEYNPHLYVYLKQINGHYTGIEAFLNQVEKLNEIRLKVMNQPLPTNEKPKLGVIAHYLEKNDELIDIAFNAPTEFYNFCVEKLEKTKWYEIKSSGHFNFEIVKELPTKPRRPYNNVKEKINNLLNQIDISYADLKKKTLNTGQIAGLGTDYQEEEFTLGTARRLTTPLNIMDLWRKEPATQLRDLKCFKNAIIVHLENNVDLLRYMYKPNARMAKTMLNRINTWKKEPIFKEKSQLQTFIEGVENSFFEDPMALDYILKFPSNFYNLCALFEEGKSYQIRCTEYGAFFARAVKKKPVEVFNVKSLINKLIDGMNFTYEAIAK